MSFQDEIPEDDDGDEGAPGWIMTFADLMSLLLTFFVLLLTFAELDVIKFKQIAGSMKVAFGVQRQVIAHDIPKGTSIIAQEFSPGVPRDTIVEVVKQDTVEEAKDSIEATKEESTDAETDSDQSKPDNIGEEVNENVEKLEDALAEEIATGDIEVETIQDQIVIRIMERDSFPSGSAEFHEDFLQVMEKIRQVLATIKGSITVAGHTDDVPISNDRFRSNWDLSAARAVSVAHALLDSDDLDPRRVVVLGHGQTRPRVANDSVENRALNRRVEIVIVGDMADPKAASTVSKQLEMLREAAPVSIDIQSTPGNQK